MVEAAYHQPLLHRRRSRGRGDSGCKRTPLFLRTWEWALSYHSFFEDALRQAELMLLKSLLRSKGLYPNEISDRVFWHWVENPVVATHHWVVLQFTEQHIEQLQSFLVYFFFPHRLRQISVNVRARQINCLACAVLDYTWKYGVLRKIIERSSSDNA